MFPFFRSHPRLAHLYATGCTSRWHPSASLPAYLGRLARFPTVCYRTARTSRPPPPAPTTARKTSRPRPIKSAGIAFWPVFASPFPHRRKMHPMQSHNCVGWREPSGSSPCRAWRGSACRESDETTLGGTDPADSSSLRGTGDSVASGYSHRPCAGDASHLSRELEPPVDLPSSTHEPDVADCWQGQVPITLRNLRHPTRSIGGGIWPSSARPASVGGKGPVACPSPRACRRGRKVGTSQRIGQGKSVFKLVGDLSRSGRRKTDWFTEQGGVM